MDERSLNPVAVRWVGGAVRLTEEEGLKSTGRCRNRVDQREWGRRCAVVKWVLKVRKRSLKSIWCLTSCWRGGVICCIEEVVVMILAAASWTRWSLWRSLKGRPERTEPQKSMWDGTWTGVLWILSDWEKWLTVRGWKNVDLRYWHGLGSRLHGAVKDDAPIFNTGWLRNCDTDSQCNCMHSWVELRAQLEWGVSLKFCPCPSLHAKEKTVSAG